MPLEATVFTAGGNCSANRRLGTISGGPVTTGPPLGFGTKMSFSSACRRGSALDSRLEKLGIAPLR